MSAFSSSNAIGIFDSGLGGLTVARAVCAAFPNEAICYLGDTARVPYGTKSPETIQRYAKENIAFLLQRGVKVIVAACNTVSAAALPDLANDCPVPVLGVVEMGAEAALSEASRMEQQDREAENVERRKGTPGNAGRGTGVRRKKNADQKAQNADARANARIGVIGTAATIASEAYVRAIHRRAPQVEVLQKACPLLVPLIEEGWADHAVAFAVIEEYLRPMREAGISVLILGCTHYPLIKSLLGSFFGPAVRIVDSAEAMARALHLTFESGTIPRAETDRSGASRYYVTDRSLHFERLAGAFMGGKIAVEQIRSDELTAARENWEKKTAMAHP